MWASLGSVSSGVNDANSQTASLLCTASAAFTFRYELDWLLALRAKAKQFDHKGARINAVRFAILGSFFSMQEGSLTPPPPHARIKHAVVVHIPHELIV